MVLWLSAALAAIAFSLANTVRGETERAATATDGTRAYYLAAGGVQRGILHLLWQRIMPGSPPVFRPTSKGVDLMQFPEGEVRVEIIPETAKMNVNNARPEDLFRLLANLGVAPERARQIALGIEDWRRPLPPDQAMNPFVSSFRPRHASIQEIEEILAVPGMTPEIFYGTYQRGPDGALIPQGGLVDCLSVFGTQGRFDINGAHPAVLATAGVPPEVVAAIVRRRRVQPFNDEPDVDRMLVGHPARVYLRVGGNTIFTLRATARPRLPGGALSDLRRTAAATVKYAMPGYRPFYHVLRWYDTAWSQ